MTCDNMTFEAIPHAESFPTIAATHRSLTSVHTYVHGQCQPAVKLFITIRASSSGAISMHTHTVGHKA